MIPLAIAPAAAALAGKLMPGPKTIAAIAILAVAFASGWLVRGKFAAAAAATTAATHAKALQAHAEAARLAIEQARHREAKIVTQAEGIVDHARQLEADLQRDHAATLADGRSLRAQAARLTARCGMANPAAPAGGSPAPQLPGGMHDGDRLLLVLGSVEGAAGAYAFDSERARNALSTCNAIYAAAREALKTGPADPPPVATTAATGTRHATPAKGPHP